jgi:hypothetical protein
LAFALLVLKGGLGASPALPFVEIYIIVYISAVSPNFKGKKIHVRSKPKNTLVACRDAPDTNIAWGLKKH